MKQEDVDKLLSEKIEDGEHGVYLQNVETDDAV